MRYARKWETQLELEKKTIGPRAVEDSFSCGWWKWWEQLRPKNVSEENWDIVAKTHGRNGMLLVLGCLLWWGDAAAASKDPLLKEDWMRAVLELSCALAKAVKAVGALYVNFFHVCGVCTVLILGTAPKASERLRRN
jgi:hypothetical protein